MQRDLYKIAMFAYLTEGATKRPMNTRRPTTR